MPLKRLVGSLVALALVGLAVVLVASLGGESTFVSSVQQGKLPAAPPAQARRFGGEGGLALDEFHGQPVVVNFFASWCKPCEDEAPLLASLPPRLAADGVALVGVASEDNQDDVRAFVDRFGLEYPIMVARGKEVAKPWGVTGYPTTFVLDAQGRATAVFIGPVTEAGLLDAVAAARGAQP